MNEENIERAWEEIDKGKIKEGINILNDVLRQTPNDWKIYYNLGQAYKIDGNIDKAIELLDKAKTIDTEGYLCNFLGLSELYLTKNDFENAIISLRDVFSSKIPKAEQIVQIIYSMGITFYNNDQIVFAKEVFEETDKMISDIVFHKVFTNEDYKPKANDDGEVDMEMVFCDFYREEPLSYQVKNNLGVCLAELGFLEEAKKAFKESIKYTPAGLDCQAPIIALKEIEDMRKEDSEIFNRLGYSEDEIQESGKIIIAESGRKIIMNKRKNE
jgi:tetratricopeptide (TPR) repeat protein